MNYRNAPNVRHAEIFYGDTLQRIALRELGDASRWQELVLINNLKPPYLVSLDSLGAGLLAYGDLIKVPAPGAGIASTTDTESTFGADLEIRSGFLEANEGGDLSIVSGIPNLSQALCVRLSVEKQELGFHPEYGCWVRALLGSIGGSRSTQLAAFYVSSSLREDDRVLTVESCTAEYRGDAIWVNAVVVAVSGIRTELVLEV